MKIQSLALLCALCSVATAQEKSKIKFGKVSPEDFATKVYSIDSNANAIVIADIGSTVFVGNDHNDFSLEFKKYQRVRILNKNGYGAANVEIQLYLGDVEKEELSGIKAVTYNLENGKVVETKLDLKAGLFEERFGKHNLQKKFTFPNIKEGSIIEYEYKISSPFKFQLQPWAFQSEYPQLWSEYNVSMPSFFYYVTLSQGYHPFYIKDQKDYRTNFAIRDNSSTGQSTSGSVSASVTDHRWVMKDVPALKEESYTSTLRNHIAKIEFQLAEYREPYTPQKVMATWTQVSEDLLKDERFGFALDRNNGWMDDEYHEAIGNAKTDIDKAKNIFSYIRNHITCTSHGNLFMQKTLKNMLKQHNGNEAEINLLMTAMLRKADLDADPVILSTRSNGYAYELYPLIDRFNYVITHLNIGGKEYWLDASRPGFGFGKLSYECYNGSARIINANVTPVWLSPDSLLERKITSVFMINENDKGFSGSVQQTPGYFESARLRDKIREKGKEQIFDGFKKGFSGDLKITDPIIDSLERYEDPIAIKYNFDIEKSDDDILYINPMFTEGWSENPFKAAQRFYPIEMPYTIDQIYLLQMEVPKGYELDELPTQVVVKLNEDNDGIFEYRISESKGTISFRSRLQLKRALYLPDEYDTLREFFNLVVKKHAEQIVFKKKK